MLSLFFKKIKGATLMEILVSTILIMSVFFIGISLVLNVSLKKSISESMRAELLFFSAYNVDPDIIHSKDTVFFPDFYIVNFHSNKVDEGLDYVEVNVFTDKGYTVSKHLFVSKTGEKISKRGGN